jgi:hypothetical protein
MHYIPLWKASTPLVLYALLAVCEICSSTLLVVGIKFVVVFGYWLCCDRIVSTWFLALGLFSGWILRPGSLQTELKSPAREKQRNRRGYLFEQKYHVLVWILDPGTRVMQHRYNTEGYEFIVIPADIWAVQIDCISTTRGSKPHTQKRSDSFQQGAITQQVTVTIKSPNPIVNLQYSLSPNNRLRILLHKLHPCKTCHPLFAFAHLCQSAFVVKPGRWFGHNEYDDQ